MPVLFGLYALRYCPLLKGSSEAAPICLHSRHRPLRHLVSLGWRAGIDVLPWVGAWKRNLRDLPHVEGSADGPFELLINLVHGSYPCFFSLIIYLRRLMPQGFPPARRCFTKAERRESFIHGSLGSTESRSGFARIGADRHHRLPFQETAPGFRAEYGRWFLRLSCWRPLR